MRKVRGRDINNTLAFTHRKFRSIPGMLTVSDDPSGHLFRQTPAIDWKFALKAGRWLRIAEVPGRSKALGSNSYPRLRKSDRIRPAFPAWAKYQESESPLVGAPPSLGAKLGRYEIRSKLGEGGMGEAYSTEIACG